MLSFRQIAERCQAGGYDSVDALQAAAAATAAATLSAVEEAEQAAEARRRRQRGPASPGDRCVCSREGGWRLWWRACIPIIAG